MQFSKKQIVLPDKKWKKGIVLDKPKKNTKRGILKGTAEDIKERDKFCVICKHSPIETIHHVFYGDEADYSDKRNNSSQLVGLCNICHGKLHFEGGNTYRRDCKKYLTDIHG